MYTCKIKIQFQYNQYAETIVNIHPVPKDRCNTPYTARLHERFSDLSCSLLLFYILTSLSPSFYRLMIGQFFMPSTYFSIVMQLSLFSPSLSLSCPSPYILPSIYLFLRNMYLFNPYQRVHTFYRGLSSASSAPTSGGLINRNGRLNSLGDF